MKYQVSFVQFAHVIVEADDLGNATKIAEFYLDQIPENHEYAEWMFHSVKRVAEPGMKLPYEK